MNPSKLLNLLAAHGGKIIQAAELDTHQINQAIASGRIAKLNNTELVWDPEMKRMPITEDQVIFFEKWYPLRVELPEKLKNIDWLFAKKTKKRSKIVTSAFDHYCKGAKCIIPNCTVCKNQMY